MRACWENTARWYEVELMTDLLGDWIVLCCWGGKHSNRCGQKPIVVSGETDGLRLIEQIHQKRIKRKLPYSRVD